MLISPDEFTKYFLRSNIKEPMRKRRKKEELEKGAGAKMNCAYCTKTLSRKQTLREHIQKFHPQHVSILMATPQPSGCDISVNCNAPYESSSTNERAPITLLHESASSNGAKKHTISETSTSNMIEHNTSHYDLETTSINTNGLTTLLFGPETSLTNADENTTIASSSNEYALQDIQVLFC